MKKITFAVLSMAAAFVSTSAVAFPDLTSGRNDVTIVNCALLANDIQIVLSNNVIGAVQCNVGDAFMALSACHTTGQRNSRSAVVTGPAAAPTCTVTATEDCVVTVTGASFPTATTTAGTVSAEFPGGNAECTDAAVLGVANAQALP